MALSIFGEKAIMPSAELLSEELQESKTKWQYIENYVKETYKDISGEWKHYSKASGWIFVVKSGKRTLLYLIPLRGSFKVNFVFGENAVVKARNTDLPKQIISSILEAKSYVEGRSFMLEVKTKQDIKTIKKLLKIKTG